MSGFVEAEDDAVLELSRFLSTQNGATDDGDAAAAAAATKLAQNPAALFGDLLKGVEGAGALSEKDMEGCYTCAFALLPKVGGKAGECVGQVLAALTGSAEGAAVRLKLLSTLFAALDFLPSARYEVFMAMVAYSDANGLLEPVAEHFKHIEAWVAAWGTTLQAKETLYSLAASKLDALGRSQEALDLLLKLLEGVDADAGVVKEAAAQAVVLCLKIPELFSFDGILDMKAVQQLKGDKKHGTAFECLSVFVGGDIAAFDALAKRSGKALTALGLSLSDCEDKMRLLSLATIAAASKTLEYGAVASALKIDEAAVDSWVVRAVSVGLIEARIDQVGRSIQIVRTTKRDFQDADWKRLGTELRGWQGSIRGMLASITQASAGVEA